MTPEAALEIVRQALLAALWLSAPLLIAGLLAGVLVSLIQVMTSMQDPAFSAPPRLAALLIATLAALPWMLKYMLAYTAGILGNLGRYAH